MRIHLLIIIIFLAVEHLLSMLSSIYYVNACPVLPNQPIESYLVINFSMFFHFVEYSTFLGIGGKIVNVLATFAWSFNDIFVMAVSVSLAARFRQLNDYMLREARSVSCKIQDQVQFKFNNFRNISAH